jgi:hypothetical protein
MPQAAAFNVSMGGQWASMESEKLLRSGRNGKIAADNLDGVRALSHRRLPFLDLVPGAGANGRDGQ